MITSRRSFLRTTALSGAGLVIAFHIPRKGRAEEAAAKGKPLPAPNAFVRIAPDESVTVLLAHSEMDRGHTPASQWSSRKNWTPIGARSASRVRRSIRPTTTRCTASK